MSTETAVPPPAVWAQRSDAIYLTLNVECSEPVYEFTENTMVFSGVGQPEGKKYDLNVEFYNKINPEKIFIKNIKRCIEFVITKADPEETFWPRLLKDKTKPHWLKVDFNRWEDDSSENDDMDMMVDLTPKRSKGSKMDLLQQRLSEDEVSNKDKLSLDDLDAELEEYDEDDLGFGSLL